MYRNLLLCLKVSRPGLWFQTLWLYLLPTAKDFSYFSQFNFWLGLGYILFPLNFLVYGLNDLADWKIDQLNPRKDSYLFGAKIKPHEFKILIWSLLLIQIPFWLFFSFQGGRRLLYTLIAILVVNIIYNLPKWGLRTHPPFELLNQLGYLLLLLFSIQLNHTAVLPCATVLYLMLFCTHSHLVGEVMDVLPDQRAGRKTSATVLGVKRTKLLIIALVLIESFWLWYFFQEIVLSVFLFLGAVWLLLDLLVFYGDRTYSRQEFNLFGFALNFSGYASLLWVWLSGKLT